MQIGTKQFQFDGHHVYVMGILNVTPDSFSDGGKFNHLDRALAHYRYRRRINKTRLSEDNRGRRDRACDRSDTKS